MGQVYLVRDTYLDKDVAMKLLHEPASRDEFESVQREFTLLSQIDHPGIAKAYDFGYVDERPYFTTEFVPGETLNDRRPIEAVPRLLRIAFELAEAVAYLHGSRILHLDIKPSNIVVPTEVPNEVPTEENVGRAVLIDFGLCRNTLTATSAAKLKGSLPYMAPEYFAEGTLGPWTDVYALGVTLYRLATGRLPRPGASFGSRPPTDERAWRPALLPPSRLRDGLPRSFDHLLLKCLALDPTARFATARDLARLLEKIGGTASLASPLAAPRVTVGRETERRAAERFLDGLQSRRGPAALLVTAPPGMGQSHFLRDVKIMAQTRGFHSYLETGYPGSPGPPGRPFRSLASHLGNPGKGDERTASRWETFLGRLQRPRKASHSETTETERRLRRASELALVTQAVQEPLLLLFDGLQFFDEISIGLTIDLIRFPAAAAPRERPPIGVVVGYREEGPSLPLLRELSDCFLAGSSGDSITLRALDLTETMGLFQRLRGQAAPDREAPEESRPGLSLYHETGGSPARIVARACASGASSGAAAQRMRRSGSTTRSRLSEAEREVVLTLYLLGRPSSTGEISRMADISRARSARILRRLEAAGLVLATDLGANRRGWIAGAAAESVLEKTTPARKRRIHRSIGDSLSAGRRGAAEPTIVEAVHHLRLAGNTRGVLEHGLRAARYLKSTFQNRAALEVFAAVLEVLPQSRRSLRLEAGLEMAELQARVGDVEQGIRTLREFLTSSWKLPHALRLRTLLRLATLHSRRGDYRRADALFREGLPEARRRQPGLAKEELLFFLNEHAAMKGFMGEHEEALRLCEEGLRLAVRSRGFAVREVALNLHATCANVASRRFDFDAAIDSYQRALEIAEAIGSSVNQAVILNNLGIVFVHSDRYGDAIEALREAESTCLRLDEGPSLATIYGNLAVLYTKRGEFEAMERCLEQARSLSPAALGRRQQFFLEHTRGVCLMYRGCYGEATNCFEAAIRFGESMGDRYVTLFDEVYRAESLVFQGRYAEATRELERLAAREDAGRVRRMAIARLAFLRALTGARPSTAKSVAEHEAGGSERKIPFLDAWDALFVGWALSVSGFSEKAQQRLSAAEGFFRRHGAAPALSLVIWIRAEGRFLAGDIQGARELLASSPGGRNDLTEFLFPLLEARLLLEGESPAAAPARAADLLARAGAALVGNRLPEWEQRFDHLRGALLGEAEYRSRVERQRAELSRELPDETRDAYLSSSHWSAWTAVELPLRETAEEAEGTAVRGRKSASTSRTASLTREDRAVARAKLVTRSSPMRHLADTLERIRETELPVLIRGETGSGKELVARIIHDESRRSAAKFQVVDCSTIPSGLLEAELFGARAGAFTDLTSDRQGILRRSAGGTVLLDEIGEFPMDVQAKLLRVIADGVIRPLGAETGERIDVRFLFSTALDLLEEVERGRFRQDLFHRIDVVSIRVPPLRERPEDLPDLVGVLLAEGAAARKDAQGGGDRDDLPELDDGAIDRLRNWPWPGNVRELKNLLSRLQLENPDRVTAADLDHLLADSDTTTVFPRSLLAQESLPALKETLERDYLLHHLRRLRGNTGALCRFLGLGRRQLYRRFERLGISLREEKRKT